MNLFTSNFQLIFLLFKDFCISNVAVHLKFVSDEFACTSPNRWKTIN